MAATLTRTTPRFTRRARVYNDIFVTLNICVREHLLTGENLNVRAAKRNTHVESRVWFWVFVCVCVYPLQFQNLHKHIDQNDRRPKSIRRLFPNTQTPNQPQYIFRFLFETKVSIFTMRPRRGRHMITICACVCVVYACRSVL